MLILLAFLLGAVSVATVAYPVWRSQRDELRIAQDRLYGAWKEGHTIPPRPNEEPAPEIPPLPKELQALVDEWESPTVRLQVEDRIRRLMARGLDTPAVAKQLFLDQQRHAFEGTTPA